MISTTTHILPLARITRYRMLPQPGTVLVRAGQQVEATDIIAETDLHTKHIMLDVARGLGISRGKAGDFIQRELGETVSKDSIIARKAGARREIRSPANGKVVAIGGGQVLLEVATRKFELAAGISGLVIDIEPDFGVTIETTGAWVQGVWGNGQLEVAGLKVLMDSNEHILTPDAVDPSLRGQIILAGYCGDRQVLEQAGKDHWSGLILGSMATQLVPVASKMNYPIVVLEGFGRIPMNEVAYRLLSTSDQREVVLNAMAYDPLKNERPEVVIPLEGAGEPPAAHDLKYLEPGLQVRLLSAPHRSAIGMIDNILPGLTVFPGGLRAQGAEVQLGDGEKVIVPLANIEVLG